MNLKSKLFNPSESREPWSPYPKQVRNVGRISEASLRAERNPTLSAQNWQPGYFDYERLDVYHLSKKALVEAEALVQKIPRGYGKLSDQLRRAHLSIYLGIAEASSRMGADRLSRFRCARGETSEAAAATEAVLILNLAPEQKVKEHLYRLSRIAAMLNKLSSPHR